MSATNTSAPFYWDAAPLHGSNAIDSVNGRIDWSASQKRDTHPTAMNLSDNKIAQFELQATAPTTGTTTIELVDTELVHIDGNVIAPPVDSLMFTIYWATARLLGTLSLQGRVDASAPYICAVGETYAEEFCANAEADG